MADDKLMVIDLGTSAIRVSLTTLSKDGKRNIIVKTAPSRGIKSGVITNVPSAADTLRSVLNKLKVESPVSLPEEAYLLIPGGPTMGLEVEAKISFPGIKTINYNDVNLVKRKIKDEIRRLRGYGFTSVYEIIHILPREFVVDGVEGIKNPIGHNGKELTIKAYVILAAKNNLKTIGDLLKDLGLKLKGTVLQSLAAFYAVKDDDAYYNNNLFIYMGAGNTEVLCFKEDSPVFFKHEPFGAEDIIDSLVQYLKVSRREAERLYREFGSAYVFNQNKEEVIDVNYGTKFRKLQKLWIPAIIHLSIRNTMKSIKKAIDKEDPSLLYNLNRVYITGGLSQLKDIELLLEKLFKAPVEKVVSKGLLKDPGLAPLEGVVDYVLSLNRKEKLTDIKEDLVGSSSKVGFFSTIWRFITQYI
ncbi:cell division FtsA domain-containing protein [Thermovibrio sp.]